MTRDRSRPADVDSLHNRKTISLSRRALGEAAGAACKDVEPQSLFGVNHVFEAFVVEGIGIREVAVVSAQLVHLQTVLQHELQAVLLLPVATALDRDVDALVAVR